MATSGEFTTTSTIDELASYDSALAQRILDIEDGKIVNGHNPNGTLSSVLANEEGAGENFISEYAWLIALHTFPFRGQEQKTSLTHAGTDALFTAGETYNPRQEPNFITHSSQVISNYLREVFGEPEHPPVDLDLVTIPTERTSPIDTIPSIPLPLEITPLVEPSNDRPTLPDERIATDFSEGQRLLFLWDGELHSARVIGVHASESPMKLKSVPVPPEEPTPIPPEELAVREALYERRLAEICDNPEAREAHHLMPDPELLRLRISMQPEFQILVPNDVPGFLKIAFRDEPGGVIIDMHHNRIIPRDAFEQLKKDPMYLAAWLAHGSREDKREEKDLVKALRTQSRFPESDEDILSTTSSPVRTPEHLRANRLLRATRHFR